MTVTGPTALWSRPALLVLLAALAGCAGRAKDAPMVEGRAIASATDRHAITVTAEEHLLETPPPGADGFDQASLDALRDFVRDYAAEGHGPVRVSAPEGAPGEAGARAMLDELVALGVPPGALATGRHTDLDPNAPRLQVRFTRFAAKAPDCAPVFEQNLAFAPDNQPWESFGCAQNANLAAMISDARDLETPRDETPTDAFRRQTILDKYREGKVTHAERSKQEGVDLSGVLQ